MRPEPAADASPPPAPPPDVGSATRPIVCADPGLGVVAFTGPDAAAFLQGQLSQDVEALAPGTVQRTSYNSPKGRMLATLHLWRDGGDGFRALVAADVAESFRKRIAMFVLRAKVVVADLSSTVAVTGIGGPGARDALAAASGSAPAPGHVDAGPDLTTVALPDGRLVVVSTPDRADALRAALAPLADPAPEAAFRWLGIRAGVPQVVAATQDLFVAQTANWDVLDGVSFHKGCYTGQEIIARTQYLGRLKERMHAFHADAPPPLPGARLYGPVFGDQACGTVVDAAPAPGGGCDLLAVVQLAALDAALHVDAPDGPLLSPQALPYALPAAVAPARPKL